MFSSLTKRLAPALRDQLDLLVELSTLGEYGVDREGLFALEAGEPAPGGAPAISRSRDDCPYADRFSRSGRAFSARP